MATVTLTGNAGSIARLADQISGAACIASEGRNITIVIDDSDFSVTYTDGASGSVKKGHK